MVVEPADFALAPDDDPNARTTYDRPSCSRTPEHVLAIASAKTAEAPVWPIEKGPAMLRDQESGGIGAAAPS